MACAACGERRERVGLRQKVQNASKAIRRAAMAYVRGRPVFSDEELVQARLNVCLDCERLLSRGNECLDCGCPVERKVKLRTESCPRNKWSALE